MKILIMTDSMFIPSGMGRVGREIALGLGKRGHQVGYIGWFHRQDIFPNAPYNIQFWPTNNNRYGADVLDGCVNHFQPDVLLTIGDLWHLWYISDPRVCKMRKHFQWCSYIPVDGEPVNGGLPPGIIKTIEDIDIPVAYTNYAKDAFLKSVTDQESRNRIQTIYHGVDTNLFKPASPEERTKLRSKINLKDKFLFLTVCRNQSRKNIPELLKAWKKFSELPQINGKVMLWLHTYFKDSMGYDIDDLLRILKLRNQSIMYYHQVAYAQSEQHLIPDQDLAKLYQIADSFILLSGEGFGLPTFEAMASRLPCVLLNHSASAELGADGRAELVHSSGEITWTGSHLTQRPIPKTDDIVESMLKVFNQHHYRESIAQKGFEFATKYTWDRVAEEWNSLFLQYEIPFLKPIELEVLC